MDYYDQQITFPLGPGGRLAVGAAMVGAAMVIADRKPDRNGVAPW